MSANPSRADDDLLLRWLSARARGESSSVIALRHGVTPERVRTATNRVLQADLRESGERAKRVEPFYWRAA